MSLPHENLIAWRRADDLFVEVHQLTHQRFPAFERYELGSQLRRAELAGLKEKLQAVGAPLQGLINKRRTKTELAVRRTK